MATNSTSDAIEHPTQSSLHGAVGSVQAYQISRKLSGLAWQDTDAMLRDPRLRDIAPQLYRAVTSIAANIAEGYARRSRPDRIRYYEYALGSVEECIAWYESGRHVLDAEVLAARLADLVSIRRLSLTMIRNERQAKSRLPTPPSAEDNRLTARGSTQESR
jgi:four helix bundle protein